MSLTRILLLLIASGGICLISQSQAPANGYYVAIVRKGPNWTPEQTPEVVRSGQEHRQYLKELSARGVVLLAGPFTDNGEIRGIYVFKVPSAIEAKKLCDAAPLVKSGRLLVEVHPWQITKAILTKD